MYVTSWINPLTTLFYKQASLILLFFSLVGCAHRTQDDKYSALSAEQIYTQGQQHLNKARYHQAVEDLEALESHFPYGEYADKGLLDLSYAYNKQGESEAALAAAERFIQLYPTHPNIDRAYYLKGVIYADQNTSILYRYFPVDRSYRDNLHAEQAYEAFAFFTKHFPKSQFVPEAHKQMALLREQLAQHELHIAEYYLKRRAFVALAERANHIVEHFPDTSAVAPALILLKTAYTQMNMPQRVDDTQKIIEKNKTQSIS